jgi:hypothetical protein
MRGYSDRFLHICNFLLNLNSSFGDLAQLARACDSQSQGRGFDSPHLHSFIGFIHCIAAGSNISFAC